MNSCEISVTQWIRLSRPAEEVLPNRIVCQIHARITSIDDPLAGIKEGVGIVPIVSLWLEDGSGQLVSYGSSIGYKAGEAVLDVVTIDET